MDKKKLDKIINVVREEMMTANPPGGSGGFSASAPAKGPRAGRDVVINKKMVRRKTLGLWSQSLKGKKGES